MTTLLAIDTAADICSVALVQDSVQIKRSGSVVRKHANDVLPMVQALLDESSLRLSQLDAIVIVSGPGSFTGLRIGAAVAQGLAFGVDIPVIRISALMMLARAAFNTSCETASTSTHIQRIVYACVHAREDEYYFSCYRDNGSEQPVVLIADQICDSASILALLKTDVNTKDHSDFCVGNGWQQSALQHATESRGLVLLSGVGTDAGTLCDLGQYAFASGQLEAADEALPVYLKEDMAYRRS
ncbi:tRNA (adenosine(37)-N6)-threonylcarbamoyltransferase complex dimerization subunit type 1 TsaB [Pseudohongiella acticola]|jgi:tRNA threonylcarbamoyladenosine biosynthesis protein TsaB|uniref:tRNA (adenosine(37)-N6)-threonylcarbamoyltransferase complex dimerization subunit type 1 TsaB n=1 Tax=Pseudohongiella acticola TaxID=1524254 RepID=UPI0030ECE882